MVSACKLQKEIRHHLKATHVEWAKQINSRTVSEWRNNGRRRRRKRNSSGRNTKFCQYIMGYSYDENTFCSLFVSLQMRMCLNEQVKWPNCAIKWVWERLNDAERRQKKRTNEANVRKDRCRYVYFSNAIKSTKTKQNKNKLDWRKPLMPHNLTERKRRMDVKERTKKYK